MLRKPLGSYFHPRVCKRDATASSSSIERRLIYPPSVAYMRQGTGPSLVQVMACRLFGSKPLPEPMLGKNQWNVNRNDIIFIQENAFENIVCQKWTPFCPGGDVLMYWLTFWWRWLQNPFKGNGEAWYHVIFTSAQNDAWYAGRSRRKLSSKVHPIKSHM